MGRVPEMDADRGDSSREEASIGTHDSERELTSLRATHDSGSGRVEVRTELRQISQLWESPRVLGWGNKVVSTEITAEGSGL